MKPAISILLVDDHALFRESLVRLLKSEAGFEVVGHCATIGESLRYLDNEKVDVVLLDYDLGEEAGTDLLKDLASRRETARVLMVTAGMTPGTTRSALEAGVAGILWKHSAPEQLIEAIRRVAKGEVWLDRDTMQVLLATEETTAGPRPSSPHLTPRQREVLRGILDGLTNKEIAVKTQSSESAVKAVIQELFHKAGVRTRSQLVRAAFEKHARDWLEEK
ncbi:MAG: response regulator transcription factor [Acidobacterium ailaaui]|nr:response regulator transcription factor [Pseudacidobacterium ailaaui]